MMLKKRFRLNNIQSSPRRKYLNRIPIVFPIILITSAIFCHEIDKSHGDTGPNQPRKKMNYKQSLQSDYPSIHDPSNHSHNARRHHNVPQPRKGNYKMSPKSDGTHKHNKATVSDKASTSGNYGNSTQSVPAHNQTPRKGNYRKSPKSDVTHRQNKTTVSQESILDDHGNSPRSDYLTVYDPSNTSHNSGYESLKQPEEGSGSANDGASQTSGYLTVYDPSYQYAK